MPYDRNQFILADPRERLFKHLVWREIVLIEEKDDNGNFSCFYSQVEYYLHPDSMPDKGEDS